jgi:hypothetical protein
MMDNIANSKKGKTKMRPLANCMRDPLGELMVEREMRSYIRLSVMSIDLREGGRTFPAYDSIELVSKGS